MISKKMIKNSWLVKHTQNIKANHRLEGNPMDYKNDVRLKD